MFDTQVTKLKYAWKAMYAEEPFPSDTVFLKDTSTVFLSPAPHERNTATPPTSTLRTYNPQTHGTYDLINDFLITKRRNTLLERDEEFMKALRSGMQKEKCELRSRHTRRFTAAFAAANPQVVPESIQLLIALGRYTLLYDINDNLKQKQDWITVENIAVASPSAFVIDNWVKELACSQVVVFREVLSSGPGFFQTDGGHEGQEVYLFSKYNLELGKVIQVWDGCTSVGGKTSKAVAFGAKQRLELFSPKPNAVTGPQIDGLCVDSGQGTPESLFEKTKALKLTTPFFSSDSCGLHDIQSVFRYPILTCIGASGLDSDDSIQLLHTMYSFFTEYKTFWSKIVAEAYWKLHELTEEAYSKLHRLTEEDVNAANDGMNDLPPEIDCSMQAPLLTRWWSISLLASLFSKYYHVYVLVCQACVNKVKTIDKKNLIASNLLRMFKETWIVADIHFLAAISDSWFNQHMNWYQCKDENLGSIGFLSEPYFIFYS